MRLILISSCLDARVAKLRVMFIELSAFPTSEDIVRSHGLLQHCKIWIWVLRPINCLRNFNCRKQSYIKECPHDWITSLLLFHYAGVILTNGRSGRETTFWTEWPKSVWQKFAILCPNQSNTMIWAKFCTKIEDEVLWRGSWTLCEYKLREMVRKRVEF